MLIFLEIRIPKREKTAPDAKTNQNIDIPFQEKEREIIAVGILNARPAMTGSSRVNHPFRNWSTMSFATITTSITNNAVPIQRGKKIIPSTFIL